MDKSLFGNKIKFRGCLLIALVSLQLLLYLYYSKFEFHSSWYPAKAGYYSYPPLVQNLYLSQQCYIYTNLTAIFKCGNVSSYNTYPKESIFKCASKKWQAIRDPQDRDPWQGSPESMNYFAISQRPSFHLVLAGDSHMRHVFEVLMRRIANPRVKHSVSSFNKKKWEDSRKMFSLKEQYYYERYQQVIHLDFPLKVTFVWDPFLKNLQQLLSDWTSGKTPRANVVVFGTALHYMASTKHISTEHGMENTSWEYTHHLELLSPLLKNLASKIPMIFKMRDHLGRDLLRVTNSSSNVDHYNEVATRVLSKTPVVLWDSTLPLADIYQEECRLHNRRTPQTGDWQCEDVSHIGYIMVDKYLDMLFNHICNNVMTERN